MACLITIMGSGETAPTMVPVHRRVFDSFPSAPTVSILDTAYGFQENADELTERAVNYFTTSFPQIDVTVASFRHSDAPAGARERALETLRDADVVFAGPGSPTYALRTWAGTEIPALLAEKASTGALTVASAASITVGAHSIPVYEIYKVGEDLRWLAGLDILPSAIGRVAVVPHFDNAEGGTHDTRFCWMGETRFNRLRSMLAPDTAILGVDEHTAAVLDLESSTLEAHGRGSVTVIGVDGRTVVPSGSTASLGLLRGGFTSAEEPESEEASENDTVAELTGVFDDALGRGAVEPALDAILELEDTHEGWDDSADAHRAIRRMVTKLGTELSRRTEADRTRKQAIELLLDVRDRARADRRWADADAMREALAGLGYEIKDTPDGTIAEPIGN